MRDKKREGGKEAQKMTAVLMYTIRAFLLPVLLL